MRRAFRLLVGRGHVERAVDDELAFHLESREQVLMSKGLSFEDARDEARAQFGNLQSIRDSCVTLDKQRERTMNRSDLLDQIRQDFRYAFRALRKARGMSTVAIVTLAVAIALLTTVFSVLNTGFFRPLPYPDSDRIVGISASMRGRGSDWNSVPLAVVNLLRTDSKSFERVAAYNGWDFKTLNDQFGSVGLRVTSVDTAILGLVGAKAQRGRLFTSQLRLAPSKNAKRALGDSVTARDGVWLPGHDVSALRTVRPYGRRLVISDEYFRVMHMSALRGRGFGPEDVTGGQHVTVVSQRLAKLLWGGEDPIGKTLLAGPAGPSFIVIGVASDVIDPSASLEGTTVAPHPNLYLSERQATFWPFIYLRPRGSMDFAQPAVESAMRFVDPEALPGVGIPLARMSGEAEMIVKIFGSAVGSMAICGMFLAMLGIYGVIAYGVTRRTREIGLRIALGARPEQVVGLFTIQAMRFTTIGLGIGVLLAGLLSLLTRPFVYGTSMLDPLPYIAGAVVFGLVSLFASWLAARRASLVEPSEALRSL